MKTHYLKTWPEPFQAVWDEIKPWEIRKNDRNFCEGDSVFLAEWCPEEKDFSGRVFCATIPFVLRDGFGVPEGYCIFTLSKERRVKRHMDAMWIEGFFTIRDSEIQPAVYT